MFDARYWMLGLVHWDDPEGWYGEGGGWSVQDGEHMYKQCCDEHWGTRVSFPSGFLSVYGSDCSGTDLSSDELRTAPCLGVPSFLESKMMVQQSCKSELLGEGQLPTPCGLLLISVPV